jgi:hypothetical protein
VSGALQEEIPMIRGRRRGVAGGAIGLLAGLAGFAGPLLQGQGGAFGQALAMEIFQLRYRTADQLVPLIRPLVPPPGTVSGIQNQLIVRSTPQNLAEIRTVLDRVDTLPRRLLITVRQDTDLTGERDAVSAGARVSGPIGDSGRGSVVIGGAGVAGGRPAGQASVGIPPSGGGVAGRVEAEVISSRRAEADRNTHQIQVLEGQPAWIQAGQTVPVPVRQQVSGPWGTRLVDTIEYREISTGFQVLARVTGDQVVLEILPQQQSASSTVPGGVNAQQLATTASGRLGEWIDLGGATRTIEGRESVLLGRASQVGTELRRVLVRVEELR